MKQTATIISLGLGLGLLVGCSSRGEKDEEDDNHNDEKNSQYDTRPSNEYEKETESTFNQCTPTLIAVVRDFSDSHSDFHHSGEEGKAGEDLVTGMVRVDLGSDEKPVAGTNRFHSDNLDQWYNTVSGVNKEYIATVQLTDSGNGVWTHNNDSFFPLGPNQGFGHENNTDGNGTKRNFLFTTELKLRFTYREGQRFRFKGDDDLWVFINGKLAIDLGGIHSEREQEIDIDAHARKYDMIPDRRYTMHIFHAERNPVESHFRIETNIECFTSDAPIV